MLYNIIEVDILELALIYKIRIAKITLNIKK